ncbi:bifunctional diaminohydroxyphosphoribosylaminopyrimidine deaminase/5-amino-6-(5-phosphoribosylamino)uracil reductase RibD [Micromonospora sp. NPDC001898]|uniref:bifunctional diaminohydroxyphosphoribosylaminopyrimidine deaminase/5-amino-6-(5-phosphoribosylamino)uracil reductase RibD n=1 Tax=Micromonospora sp. NPDC001898 TaxID=3364221 RepID=UPI0036CFAF4D
MDSGSVDEAMRRAIALAARGLGTASPNPVVGCVLLDPDGEVVGEGFHAYAGGPHAEIVALAQAGRRARGGTAVVTLEPCDHTGRTGPCSRALIVAGIARVVVAVPDPDPVAAGGAATLRAAGVRVEFGVRAAEAEAGNVTWLTSVRRGWPYVVWKFAATLDGRSAAVDGTSMWITSEEARADVHALRGTVDAVIAGVGTVLADDPRLTVRNLRDGTLAIRQPLRVVVDSLGRTPAGARVRDGAAGTWIATAAQVGAGPDGRVDLPELLAELHRRGVRAALLEGGPSLAGAFLSAGLVDRVVGYVAPRLLGAGPTALADAGVTTIADAIDLEITDVTQIGPDLRITALPRKREG